jgi:exoribonuclease-2
MLPERLSTDLTSLNADVDRLGFIVEMLVEADGSVKESAIQTAIVRNKAKLAYDSVAAWLDGLGPMPREIGAADGLEENLRLQDRMAAKMKERRHARGALDFKTIKIRPKFEGDILKDVEPDQRNRAKDIIENFMVAANGVAAEFLASKSLPSLRRVVRTPKRWERIVELAFERGFTLPSEPDAKALEGFLAAALESDPLRFPDLSLAVIKLLGPGEYVVERPGEKPAGHFSLAVRGYTHSTAPNRRYPDLVTQRMLKAALSGNPAPYKADDLAAVAARCTEMENNVKKVERKVEKSAAAMLLENKIGTQFDAIITGASDKGVWVRLLEPPFVEGRLASNYEGLDVGCRLRAQLARVDVERGYIDFKKI